MTVQTLEERKSQLTIWASRLENEVGRQEHQETSRIEQRTRSHKKPLQQLLSSFPLQSFTNAQSAINFLNIHHHTPQHQEPLLEEVKNCLCRNTVSAIWERLPFDGICPTAQLESIND